MSNKKAPYLTVAGKEIELGAFDLKPAKITEMGDFVKLIILMVLLMIFASQNR